MTIRFMVLIVNVGTKRNTIIFVRIFQVRFGAASPIDLKHQEGEHKSNASKKHQQIKSKQGQEKEQCKEIVESEEEVWLNSDDEIMTLEEIEAEDAMHQHAATSFRDPIF